MALSLTGMGRTASLFFIVVSSYGQESNLCHHHSQVIRMGVAREFELELSRRSEPCVPEVLGHKISFHDCQIRLVSTAALARCYVPALAAQVAHPALSHVFGLPSLVPLLLDDLSYRCKFRRRCPGRPVWEPLLRGAPRLVLPLNIIDIRLSR
jgi:hypothetical protein